MALLYISSIVPDEDRFRSASFTRSGNNVLMGIAKSIPAEDLTIVSCRPTPSYPHAPLFIKGESVKLTDDKDIEILPTFNLKVVKNFVWAYYCKRIIKKWAKKHNGEPLDVLVYNIYTPSLSSLYSACESVGANLHAILYDLGVPPKRLGLPKLTMWAYKAGEQIARKYLPKIAGRIVINENIVEHYAPGKDYILIDGGVNEQVIGNLFTLNENKESSYNLVLAGMLWDQNGTKLVLDMLSLHPELKVKVYFAGKGIDVPLIEKDSQNDDRIIYTGMLTMEELFKLYEKADILLNLRLEEEVDFHFPSKLLEYMVTGKHVLSTPVAHAERDYGKFMSILHDKTPDGLAHLLCDIMNRGKSSLYKQGCQAREYMLTERTWQHRTKEILEYINSKHK